MIANADFSKSHALFLADCDLRGSAELFVLNFSRLFKRGGFTQENQAGIHELGFFFQSMLRIKRAQILLRVSPDPQPMFLVALFAGRPDRNESDWRPIHTGSSSRSSNNRRRRAMQQAEHVPGFVVEHFARAAQRGRRCVGKPLLIPEFREVTDQTADPTRACSMLPSPNYIMQIARIQILHRDAQVHDRTASAGTFSGRIELKNHIGIVLSIVRTGGVAQRPDDGARQFFSGTADFRLDRLFQHARWKLKKNFGILAHILDHLFLLGVHVAQRLQHDRAARARSDECAP